MARGRRPPVSAVAKKAVETTGAGAGDTGGGGGATSSNGPRCCRAASVRYATAINRSPRNGSESLHHPKYGFLTKGDEHTNAPARKCRGVRFKSQPSAFDDDQVSRPRPELPRLGDGEAVGVVDLAAVGIGWGVERREIVAGHDPVGLRRVRQRDSGHLALID